MARAPLDLKNEPGENVPSFFFFFFLYHPAPIIILVAMLLQLLQFSAYAFATDLVEVWDDRKPIDKSG